MHSPSPSEREHQIFGLWERGIGLDRWARDDALLLGGGASARQPLARAMPRMLALRGRLFDRALPLRSNCPACCASSAFEIDSVALSDELNALKPPARDAVVDCAGLPVALRAPTADDLRAIAVLTDLQNAGRALLSRCASGVDVIDRLDEHMLAELDACLERLDPAAIVSFTVDCPACRHQWSASLDVGEVLWAEVQQAAERALLEVDALAHAYGWTESEVLRLSPARRAAYLQLVGAS